MMGLKRWTMWAVTGLAMMLALSGCALDEEEELRDYLKDWVFLAQTKHFVSKSTCTIAVFELAADGLRSAGPRQVDNFREALTYIKKDRAVWFDMPGVTPHQVSRGIMSLDLPTGLGLVSAGVGPALDCIEDPAISNGFHAVITSPQAITIYDPAHNALLMIYPPEMLLLFMRGNV